MFENQDLDFDDNLPFPSEPVPRKRTSILPRNVVKRKFPGPAGLLPDRRDLDLTFLDNSDGKHRNDEEACSQMSLSVFQSGPWLEMSHDYKVGLERFNIKWIKSRAGLDRLPNRKAPFLAAIIKSVEAFDGKMPIVNVILRDVTGEIQGTIIQNLYEEYSNNLIIGSVIVLKQFGVLTIGSNNDHHLTITPNNLAAIYWRNKDEDGVKVIKVQPRLCHDFGVLKTPVIRTSSGSSVDNLNLSLEDDLVIPDNLEERILEEHKKSEENRDVTINCSQVSVRTSQEHSQIWQNVFEDVDAASFFDEF